MADWNTNIIEEFRANDGHVASFGNQPLLLLHHRGAKSGTERVNPLAYQKLDNGWAVFASKGGAPTNPDWYHNVLANPRVRAEIGNETHDLVAREATGEERDRIWKEQKRFNPGFAEYEEKTTRQIPVIVLEPENASAAE
ncbi:MAG: nitroreductase family deazaflavin-dependent oxidoreductase [Actinomycetota bacterium]